MQQQPVQMLTIGHILALTAQMRQVRTIVPALPESYFTPFFDAQKAMMHATIDATISWQESMRMAFLVRNDMLRLEADWRQWQLANFASVTMKQATDLQMKAHIMARMIHAIADRLQLLAAADFGSAAQQNADVGIGSISQGPLGRPAPSSAHNLQPPDIDELAQDLSEKLTLHFAGTVECSIAPDGLTELPDRIDPPVLL